MSFGQFRVDRAEEGGGGSANGENAAATFLTETTHLQGSNFVSQAGDASDEGEGARGESGVANQSTALVSLAQTRPSTNPGPPPRTARTRSREAAGVAILRQLARPSTVGTVIHPSPPSQSLLHGSATAAAAGGAGELHALALQQEAEENARVVAQIARSRRIARGTALSVRVGAPIILPPAGASQSPNADSVSYAHAALQYALAEAAHNHPTTGTFNRAGAGARVRTAGAVLVSGGRLQSQQSPLADADARHDSPARHYSPPRTALAGAWPGTATGPVNACSSVALPMLFLPTPVSSFSLPPTARQDVNAALRGTLVAPRFIAPQPTATVAAGERNSRPRTSGAAAHPTAAGVGDSRRAKLHPLHAHGGGGSGGGGSETARGPQKQHPHASHRAPTAGVHDGPLSKSASYPSGSMSARGPVPFSHPAVAWSGSGGGVGVMPLSGGLRLESGAERVMSLLAPTALPLHAHPATYLHTHMPALARARLFAASSAGANL
jgi:hypothetical protein